MVLLKLSMRQIQRSLESDDLIKCSYRELNSEQEQDRGADEAEQEEGQGGDVALSEYLSYIKKQLNIHWIHFL